MLPYSGSTPWRGATAGGLPLLVLFSGIVAFGVAGQTQDECLLRFSISQSMLNTVEVNGSLTAVGFPTVSFEYGGSERLFLSGDLFLELPPGSSAASDAPCETPSTLEELLDVLPDTRLVRPTWASPVTLWPSVFELDVPPVTIFVHNMTLAITSEVSEEGAEAGTWAPELGVTMERILLHVVVPPSLQALKSSTNVSDSNYEASVTSTPLTFEAAESGSERVAMRLAMTALFSQVDDKTNDTVALSLSTGLYAEAVLGCNPGCGRRSRCALDEAGAPYCECMCGWGGTDCAEPAFCPAFRSQAAAPASCNSDATDAPEEAPLGAYEGICPTTQMPLELGVVDDECRAQTCECLPGFNGPDCMFCSTDEACQVWARRQGLPKPETATCDTAAERNAPNSITSKAMWCEPTSAEVAPLLGYVTVDCWTNTTLNGEFSPPPGFMDALAVYSDKPVVDPTMNMCLLKVQVTVTPNPAILQCIGYNCEIASDSLDSSCFGSICPSCEGTDCATVASILDDISGAAILCEGNKCDMELSGLPDISKFAADCWPSQCVVADDSGDEQTFGDVESLATSTMERILPAILSWAVIIGIAALWAAYGVLCVTADKNATNNQVHVDDELYDNPKPGAPCTLSFTGLTVEVAVAHSRHANQSTTTPDEEAHGTLVAADDHDAKRSILVNLNGQLRSGTLTGLMGPSGSGKTTLLNALMKRTVDMGRADVHGSVELNGTPLPDWFPSVIGYVPQFDLLMPGLTCRELITFSANLRLPAGTSQKTIEAHVEETLVQLGIEGVGDSIAVPAPGMGSRGISGGEQRRVAVALELVVKPQLLFLDEATSGLDSFRAEALVRSLREYAHGPGDRLVVLTVHQPSPAIFSALDGVVCLLSGRLAFQGAPNEVIPFFAARGYAAPTDATAAEHMLTVINAPEVAALVESGEWRPYLDKGASEGSLLLPRKVSTGPEQEFQQPKPHGIAREAELIWTRSMRMLVRSPALVVLHCLMGLVVGTLMGVAFLNVQTDISGVQNRNGALFFALVFLSLASLSTVDVIFMERAVVRNEALSGHYSPVTYVLIKGLIDAALLRIIPALLLCLPFYYLMGLHHDSDYVAIFLGVVPTFSAAAGLLSLFICTISNTPGSANLVIIVVLLISMLFSGLIANLDVMPKAVSWISFLSIFRYAFEALLGNELDGQRIIPKLGDIELDIVLDGNGVIEQLGLSSDHLLRDVIMLNLLTLLLWLLSGLSLWVRYVGVPKRQKHRY